ncbi:cytochrome P450 [Rubripirellula lacrimiformis]|nr:cytochrome P450 [Rubripirellula lacrimiformis]
MNDWDPDGAQVTSDQVAAYDDMRRRCPIAHSEHRGWSVFRHADVMQVLSDHETFSSKVSRHVSVPNGMDPPDHTKYRRLIQPYFAADRIAAFQPACRSIASQLLRQICSGNAKVEVMGELATPFAARVQCAFLGWPDSLHTDLIRWAADHHDATRRADRESLSRLANQLDGIIDDLIHQRTAAGQDATPDLTFSLINETFDGRKLNNQQIASILRNWTVGEVGTIAASIGIIIHHLARNTQDRAALRADSSRWPNAIDEILRVHNPLHGNRRVTTCPVQLGDRSIGSGERVYINWISANRDDSVFPDAAEVQLDRSQENNLLYGSGIHVCPGAPLARMELLVFMEELFAITPAFTLQSQSTVVPAKYPESGYSIVPIQFQI